jgi:hypothetical protein
MHICLINLPRYEIHRPPLSLAILGAICDEENVNYDCVDFSLRIWQQLPEYFTQIDTFSITRQIEPECLDKLTKLVDQTVAQILKENPTTVFAMSLLSTWSQPVCELFCHAIKSQSSNEILLGGQGLADEYWTQDLKQRNLVDYYIIGEGEIVFRKFLQGQRDLPGLNNYNFEQIDDLDAHCVIPNYTKLLEQQYPFLNQTQDLFITASRGCVRSCAYCDIGHQWKKYRYRSGSHVAQEMITQFERHGIQDFFFTDSLINGSMKMLDELCDILIAYKKTRPDAKFKWRGQYIFRPQELVKERHIQKMVEAGVVYLIVGLETGSDAVRYDMNKNHSTQDAEWFLEMFKKHGISCHLLMITGWVTETLKDHQDTLDLFPRWQKFVASGTITGIELGSTLSILEHSPIGHRVQDLDISLINDKPYLWESAKNPDLTIAERIRRRVETHYTAMKYHWPITRSLYRLETIKQTLIEAVDYLQHNPVPKPRRSFRLVAE